MNAATDFDCVVIGAGPTGAVLTALLAQRGHRVLVVERDERVFPLPRAVHFDHEIARVLQEVGVMDRLLPTMSAANEYRFENAAGELLVHVVMPRDSASSGWEASYMFVQPQLEQVLRDRLGELVGATAWWGAECVAIAQSDETVALTLRRAGRTDVVRARYAIGCDGASSAVRNLLGLEMDDLGFDEPWVVIDTKPKRGIGLDDTTAYQYCNPARPTTCVPAGPGRRRWEFMLLPCETRESIATPESVWQLLAPWGGEAALDLVRVAVYRFHALIARQWRSNRVLLAGDAAHQMPPFMGQGMCSGIRDAANLAWKLDLVLSGVASDVLLDSYETERAPHVRHIVETSIALGRVVCEQDAERAAQRDALLLAARRTGANPLGGQGGQAARIAQGVVQCGSTGAGELFPQPHVRVRDGIMRLDDVVGAGARLMLASNVDLATVDERIAIVSLQDSVSERETSDARTVFECGGPRATAWLRERGAVAALVRPDHYVYGTAATVAAAAALVESFLSEVTNNPSPLGEIR
jgi:2-polyprenyl-6-methoxyphenol hydroxylase-like FAD-dependent oxidoreductase